MPTATCDGRTTELRPHTGRLATTTAVESIDLGQWFVLLGGIHVGYLNYKPGSDLVWLEELTEADAAAIAAGCEAITGWRPGLGTMRQPTIRDEGEDE